MEPTQQPQHKLRLLDILFFPIGCLIQMPLLAMAFVAIVGIVGSILYNTQNSEFWGHLSKDYNNLTISKNYEEIKNPEEIIWKISYENKRTAEYNGLVRHVSPIHMGEFPMLTHDILITSGDFADSEFVVTSVQNHHFTWKSLTTTKPQGTINLIHAVPANEEIYRQLLQIQNLDQVTITGKEIQRINLLKENGSPDMWWQDSGCNTLLIQTVTKLNE